MDPTTRRTFLYASSAAIAARMIQGAEASPASKLGIASTSFGADLPPRAPQGAGPRVPGGGGRNALDFLEKCHALGAAGIQTQLNGDLVKLRARADELGMWIEGFISIPRTEDTTAFERQLRDAKAAGASAMRVAMLGGRRYESFNSTAEWDAWMETSHQAIKRAVPIAEREKMTLAIENHKDWTAEQLLGIMQTYQSEYLGVLLDFGNNIALMDDPMEMTRMLAPYVKATHLKDMGVRMYEDGFLLSEVNLGAGLLDLKGMVDVLEKANPKLHFSLEMITRDPLKVPCLTEKYWQVFPERNGKYLAQTLRLVEQKASAMPLPVVSKLPRPELAKVEEDNVKACMKYAADTKFIA
jgi:3-oxoisoapionate decarboxylase